MNNILVVGGLGYLGCIITDQLHRQGKIVDVLDCAMFDNEDVMEDINCRDLHLEPTYKIKDQINPDDYDLIIWTSDIDIDEYYQNEIPEEEFFNKCLKAENGQFYYIGHFISDMINMQNSFQQFINDRKEQVLNHDGKYFNCGILYGASPRMRWDTIINQMILLAHDNNFIPLVGNWLYEYPICNVLDAVGAILCNEISNNEIQLHSNVFSLIEISHIIASCFEEVEVKVISGADIESIPCREGDIEEEKNTIFDAIDLIVKGLEANHLPDYQKDKYNNGRVISSMLNGKLAWERLR